MDNTDNKSGTQFWNESANEINLNIEEKGNDNYEDDLEGDKSKIEESANFEIYKVQMKQNREGKEKLCERYGNRLKRNQIRKQKSVRELEK